MATQAPQFLLIDGSYYMFYRYFALLNWWKLAHPDEILENPSENKDFMERFRVVFKKEKCLNSSIARKALEMEDIEFYKEQIKKYQKLKQTAPNPERVEQIIQGYKEELAKIQPNGLNKWIEK